MYGPCSTENSHNANGGPGDPKWHCMIHSCVGLYYGVSKCLTESISHQTYSEKSAKFSRSSRCFAYNWANMSTLDETSGTTKHYVTDIMKEGIGINS